MFSFNSALSLGIVTVLLRCAGAMAVSEAEHKSTLDPKVQDSKAQVEKLMNLTPSEVIEIQRPPVAGVNVPKALGGKGSQSDQASKSSASGSSGSQGAPALTDAELKSFRDEKTNRDIFATATVDKNNAFGLPEGAQSFTFEGPNEVAFLLEGGPKRVPANNLELTDSQGKRVTPVTAPNVAKTLALPKTAAGPSIRMGSGAGST